MFSKLKNFIDDCLWRYHFRKDLQKRWQNFWVRATNRGNGSAGNQGF